MASITDRTERDLVLACANGAADDWEDFVRRYDRHIRLTVEAVRRRYDAPRCETDDMVAAVYERLLEDRCRRLRAWEERSKFATYLVLVARRLCLDYIRKHNKDFGVDRFDDILDQPAGGGAPDDEAARKARLDALRAAIDALPPKQALIMRMRLEGHSLRKIAEVLKLPFGTVSVENSRALETLRKTLHPEDLS